MTWLTSFPLQRIISSAGTCSLSRMSSSMIDFKVLYLSEIAFITSLLLLTFDTEAVLYLSFYIFKDVCEFLNIRIQKVADI